MIATFHNHSTWSDGQSSFSEIHAFAKSAGVEILGLSNRLHVNLKETFKAVLFFRPMRSKSRRHLDRCHVIYPRTLSSVPRPASESMVVDATGQKPEDMNEYYQADYCDPNSGNTCPALHRNGFNALFVDGHVEWFGKQWINNRASSDVFWSNPRWW